MPDTDARLQVYLDHRRALIDYATPMVGSRAGAEDVVQDAWLRYAMTATPQAGMRSSAGYLYRIVRNLAVDMVRRLGAETRRDKHYAQRFEDVAAPSPEEEAGHRDDLLHIGTALAELPDLQRQAFEMNRLAGLPFHEIGGHLGVSTATAHRLVQGALVHVMKRLQKPGAGRGRAL
ncbi:sigma-70 family RNA polymerase sigma factor [Novosphingobium terrae]|uniref:sigma-70 family RNA polymerase sigma factor n=1 Tax=Novosphingobium terrae TaxID=2726189 RepID=UPI0019808729|nr:sigma-70 family RNA polymerase sigma factor [Novosphingobium terrae]